MTPDVNVLVAAAREDHPHHAVAHIWLKDAVQVAHRQSNLRIMGMVVAGFLRVMTHPKTFTPPTPMADAVIFIEVLLSRPGVALLATQGEWPLLKSLCLEKDLLGNDVPDAWIAACVLQHRETLATFDPDFAKLLKPKHLHLLKR